MSALPFRTLTDAEITQYAADIYQDFAGMSPLTDPLQALFRRVRMFSRLLVRERVALNDHIRNLDAQLRDLESQALRPAAAAGETSGRVTAVVNEALTREIASLEGQLAEATGRAEALAGKFAEAQTGLDALQIRLREAETQISERDEQLARVGADSQALGAERAERQKMAMELSDLQTAYRVVRTELAATQAAVNNSRGELLATRERLQQSMARVAELEKLIVRLTEEKASLEARLTQAETQQAALTAEVADLRNKTSQAPYPAHWDPEAHEKRLQAVMAVARDKQARLVSAGAEIATLGAQLKSAQGEVAGYQGKVLMSERRLKDATDNLRYLQDSVNQTAARLLPLLPAAKRIVFDGITVWDGPTFNMLSMEIMESAVEGGRQEIGSRAKQQDEPRDAVVAAGGNVVQFQHP